MSQQSEFSFIQAIRLLGKPITYYPNIAKAFKNDVKVAIFLSNFYYWDGKQNDTDGWIYKSQNDITKETGLSRTMQESARKKLKEMSIIEEELRGAPAKLYYKFDWDRLNEILENHFKGTKTAKLEREDVNPLLYDMKLEFDKVYVEQTDIEYEWTKDSKGGKDWKNLKLLKEVLSKRILMKKAKQQFGGKVPKDAKFENFDAAESEILDSWKHFLSMLPDYHRKTNLTPALLYSNFNKVILEVTKKLKHDNQKPTSAENAREHV